VSKGRVGVSPLKRGPRPTLPDILLDVTVCHAEVSHVGDEGELNGKAIKRIMNTVVMRTKFDKTFIAESVWKELQTRHAGQLQAANRVTMEECRSKWKKVNNLDQWFDDMKKDLIESGLADDREVQDSEGQLLSELDFCSEDVKC
jgi:hypothetical protein